MGKIKKEEQIDSITFQNEVKNLESNLKHNKMKVNYLVNQATKENYDKLMLLEPKILHFSCHGLSQKLKTEDASTKASIF